MPVIEFQNVTKEFEGASGPFRAVHSLNLVIEPGEIHCLLGTSGCGKTTTMKMVNRLVEPTEGRVVLEGTDVLTLDPITLRRRIGYVIQSGGLFPHMNVGTNVGVMGKLEGWAKPKIEQEVAANLERVGLDPKEYASRYPAELSGGQKQRVGVARALFLDPRYVLMDEPFGALDPVTRGQVQDEFLALHQQVAKTVIMVTHDVGEALKMGDRISLMDQGKIVQSGTPEEISDAPKNDFVRAFLAEHLDVEAGR